MRKITQIQTIDGVIHPDEHTAKAHLSKLVENRIGSIVDKLRDKKRLEIWEILHANLKEFAILYEYFEDSQTIDDDDEF